MRIHKLVILCLLMVLLSTYKVYANPCGEDIVTEEDFYVLSHVIAGEAGADYCTDELMYYVGSVVLNRVEHDSFPDSIKEVALQEGQYQCVNKGVFNKEPSERVKRITLDLLLKGSRLPKNVVFQANFIQGEVYCEKQGVYFCRLNRRCN